MDKQNIYGLGAYIGAKIILAQINVSTNFLPDTGSIMLDVCILLDTGIQPYFIIILLCLMPDNMCANGLIGLPMHPVNLFKWQCALMHPTFKLLIYSVQHQMIYIKERVLPLNGLTKIYIIPIIQSILPKFKIKLSLKPF